MTIERLPTTKIKVSKNEKLGKNRQWWFFLLGKGFLSLPKKEQFPPLLREIL